jgi:hydrogenase maturation factor
MNLVSGEIVEIYTEDRMTMAKVKVGRAFTRVSLIFLSEAAVGDSVLIESGVAISKVEAQKIGGC